MHGIESFQRGVDPQDGNVVRRILSDQLCEIALAIVKGNLDPASVFDNVVVGQDVSLSVDDRSGP